MTDANSHQDQRNRTSINLLDRADILYWTEILGVSESGLRNAVQRVGHSVLAVREYLKSQANQI